MGFVVKENTNFKEMMKEVEYLNEIGVTYISGGKLGNMISEVIVDESKSAYLVGTGMLSPNMHDVERPIYYYSFCKDGLEYRLEVIKGEKGNVYDQNIEMNWHVKIIHIPENVDWNECKAEIYEMIEDAMKVKAYSSYGKKVSKECFKSVCIKVGEWSNGDY